jgi:hypothetical protein
MQLVIPTRDPTAVAGEVQKIYQRMFPGAGVFFVPQVFGWVIDCFTGYFGEYQPVDTRYHDFEHTLQGTLCLARLLYGRHCAEAKPDLSVKYFELGLLAILLHDTGYLKRRDDIQGTGAKYTAIHVGRSAEFAARLLSEKQFTREDITAVQNMIHCTGVDAALDKIPFQNEMEKITGFALGTADLVGQMAAEDYVDKLPVLYDEFAEAEAHSGSSFVTGFTSAGDLMQKTPMFWKKIVLGKLEHEFGGLYQFLNSPYPHGPNAYLNRIEANVERLKQLVPARQPESGKVKA